MSCQISIEILMKKLFLSLVALAFVAVSGCASDDGYTAGDLRALNHTLKGINSYSVNGYGGAMTGNSCCIMLPEKWTPGLKARVEWEVDPNPYEKIPMKKKGFGYDEDAYIRHAANYEKYNVVVSIPQYGKERCGLTVHFLTCNRVKVTTSCYSFNAPEYPIKEPFNMEEPATCSVK